MSLICYRISIIFAMIVIGFVCSKTKMLPFESNKYLIMLIMNITSPCLLVTFISLIIWPVVTFLAVNWLPLDVYVRAMLVYASAFPTMVMIVVIAASEKKNTQFAAEAVALTTMFSVITLPAATVLLTMYYGI